VEIFSRSGPSRSDRILAITDEGGFALPVAQPGQIVNIHMSRACEINDLIRKPLIQDT
jgi:hypothetical protein